MNRVIEGLNIIAKYDPDSEIRFEHDHVWFGDYEKTVSQMTEAELEKLELLGFSEDEDSWSTFQ